MSEPLPRYCDFCGKSAAEVLVMIAGPRVFICDECVQLCGLICAEEAAKRAAAVSSESEAQAEREEAT